MTKNFSHKSHSSLPSPLDEDIFLDDITDLFFGLNTGHVGRYAYGKTEEIITLSSDPWAELVRDDHGYYIAKADKDLCAQARQLLPRHIPTGTHYIDFGVGSLETLRQDTLPTVQRLGCNVYHGVDYCHDFLENIENCATTFFPTKVRTHHTDFFDPQNAFALSSTPALGSILGITIGNFRTCSDQKETQLQLTQILRNLSTFTNSGWLLLTIDTNQDEMSLLRAYTTPAVSKFCLNIISRAGNHPRIVGLTAAQFTYQPRWFADKGLLAHYAVATSDQSFTIGNYEAHIRAGDSFQLMNSYKFTPSFFEDCCAQANMEIVETIHHDSPIKMYLLKAQTTLRTQRA